MWIPNFAHYLLSHPAWLICYLVVLAGISAMLVDIDHPLWFYLHWGKDGRYLLGYFTIAGVILTCSGLGLLIALVCRQP